MRAFVSFTYTDPIKAEQAFGSCFITDAPTHTAALRAIEKTLQKAESLVEPPTIISLTLMPNLPTRRDTESRILKVR